MHDLEGSEGAKERLEVILETIRGTKSIESAAAELGIARSAFHKLRERTLREALESLEPRPRGRPPAPEETPQERRLRELESENQVLRRRVVAAQIRAELALLMPEVLEGRDGERSGEEKKK